MKTCAICGYRGSEPVCPRCGEASWALLTVPAASEPDDKPAVEPEAPEPGDAGQPSQQHLSRAQRRALRGQR